jgi:hypothetical protein
MKTILQHSHNDVDSQKLYAGDSLQNAPQESVSEITGTADATYSANEQTMLNDIKASLNDLIDKLQTLGILK